MDFAKTLVDELRNIVYNPNLGDSDISTSIQKCKRAHRKILSMLQNAQSMEEKHYLTTALADIKSFENILVTQKNNQSGYVPRNKTATNRVKWEDTKSAFSSRIRTGVIINLKHTINVEAFFEDCTNIFIRRIKSVLKTFEMIKVNTIFCGLFAQNKPDKIIEELKHFNTKNAPIYQDTDLPLWFQENAVEPLLTKLQEFEEKNSGWTLKSIVSLQVNINKYNPQLGSLYIELPAAIKSKQACINVKNNDNLCFAWSVMAALYPAQKNPQRTTKYRHPTTVLELSGIKFPMTIKQIPKFEKQNNISVNVYILKKPKGEFKVYPTYLTKDKKQTHVNLLMIQEDYGNDNELKATKYHFVWIKSLSGLLSSQLSKNTRKKHFCDRCLHYFYSEEKLNKHYEDCKNMNECKVRLPNDEQKNLKFKNFKNKVKVPFIIYADLESILKPTAEINKYQEHEPYAIGYYFKCSYDDSLSFYKSYTGLDCMTWFSKELEQLAEDMETVFLCPLPMDPLTRDQKRVYNSSTCCHICEQQFIPGENRARDHNHLTGQFRGAAHDTCNINYQDDVTVPVVMHNLSGYDSYFVVKSISSDVEGRMDLLPVTKEKYISFTKRIEGNIIKFRFIDSFRFLAESLDSLASNLTEYPLLRSEFADLPAEKFKLLTRKGVFPYDFIDSLEKLQCSELPPKKSFYNKLEERHIYQKEYVHAQNVWKEFNCSCLQDYSDLYLKTDIFLLADVFETFRKKCLETHKLDPAHYYTLPGFTWDCMLKFTNVELELLTDIDMVMFVERGIRGGLSQCSKHRATANNKYIPNYDPEKPDTYLMYFDINNQYGYAMSEPLPYGGFKWADTNIDVEQISEKSDTGYFLEVDLEYPENVHDLHKDLPFCPEHRSVTKGQKKLMATLHYKERYVIHYRTLQQALKHGLVLAKIHRVLEFKQSAWLKDYIDLNTRLRAKATTSFEKDLYKLLNNAVFGKTMENVRKYSKVKLINKWDGRYGAEALVSKPEFKSALIFNENLVMIELNKTEVFFNKPIYVGMAILDLAKTTIYDFHYSYMLPEFGSDSTVVYTDTDSLVYEIRNKNIYEVMRRDCHVRFDTSDYATDNIYNIPQVNKKVLGLMKDELKGRIMTDFVGLKAKMYTLKILTKPEDLEKEKQQLEQGGLTPQEIEEILGNDGVTKKIKGIKKGVVKRVITFDDFVECLEEEKEKPIHQNLIKSDKFNVFSVTQHKIALSPHDDKRWQLKGSYDTLPWGHYSLINN